MADHAQYMQRCTELASKGAGYVAPNPMVGCVIVYKDTIIGEGYHETFGGPHAEVNAVSSVDVPSLLAESTLYVTLEPCSHYGKTPPCSTLILQHRIPRVVIGTRDPFKGVNGRGIAMLQRGGVEVIEGILENECRWLNRRFITFHQLHRPYIILKWAQSADGFFDKERVSHLDTGPNWITSELARKSVHQLRAEEASILVGTQTAKTDNPRLTVRDREGNSPLRMVIDRDLSLPQHLALFDQSVPTLVFTEKSRQNLPNIEFVTLQWPDGIPLQIVRQLYQRDILSLIVEGGSYTLQSFIDLNLWDEAHIYTGNTEFTRGLRAPLLTGRLFNQTSFDGTLFAQFLNPSSLSNKFCRS